MRLINTKTGKFEEFFDAKTIPFYAILSHTWVQWPDREQTYQDVVEIQEKFGLSSSSDIKGRSNQAPNPPGITSQAAVGDGSEPHAPSQTTPSTHEAAKETGPLPSSSLPEQTEHARVVGPAPTSLTPSSIWDPGSGLSEKVQRACEVARKDGYRYIWVDSCCIDKTSSSELSEAINSMFNWYRDAQICYAFLADVPSAEDVRDIDSVSTFPSDTADEVDSQRDSKFRESRWFQRAWTLQELIAPHTVVFLSDDWKGLGTKHSLAGLIKEITHIDRDILTHKKDFADETVAKRMRWAAEREATRVEDRAYSLLGIFGITMPTLYGEGQNAFRRLQEEILQRIPDRSLFAWGECRPFPQGPNSSIRFGNVKSPFATSPQFFADEGGHISMLSKEDFRSLQDPAEEYTVTPHGIRTKLRFIPIQSLAPSLEIEPSGSSIHDVDPKLWHLLVLSSKQGPDGQHNLLGKLCTITQMTSMVKLLNVPHQVTVSYLGDTKPEDRLAGIPTNNSVIFTVPTRIRSQRLVEQITVYLSHPTPSVGDQERMAEYEGDIPQSTVVSLSPWAQGALPPRYTISESDLHPTKSPFLSLRLSNDKDTVNLLIHYRHMHIDSNGQKMGGFGAAIEARIWTHFPDSTLDKSPPYTSAIWAVDERHSTLPPRNVHIITQSGAQMTLRLWLGVAKYRHYHTYVEVVTHGPHPTNPLSTRDEAFPMGQVFPLISKKHKNLKFTLLGSVKRALEDKGYSTDLQKPQRAGGNSPAFSLTISNARHTITIKYFYVLNTIKGTMSQRLIVVACVILESSSDPSDGSERYRDGPYVSRSTERGYLDESGWSWSYGSTKIYLTLPTGRLLALTLGLDLAWASEYYLVVDISPHPQKEPEPWELEDDSSWEISRLRGLHDRTISLNLPAHIKRALQAHGYEVRFRGPTEDHSNPYCLILSNSNLTINIEYSYHLSTGSDGQQGLSFRAYVTTSPLQGSKGAATQAESQIMDWDAWQPDDNQRKRGWGWTLPPQAVKLEHQNGSNLRLRLGLYLVWLSEYCITVEVIPEDHSPSRKERLTRFLGLFTPTFIRHRRKHKGNQQGGASISHEDVRPRVAMAVASPLLGVEDAEEEGADAASSSE